MHVLFGVGYWNFAVRRGGCRFEPRPMRPTSLRLPYFYPVPSAQFYSFANYEVTHIFYFFHVVGLYLCGTVVLMLMDPLPNPQMTLEYGAAVEWYGRGKPLQIYPASCRFIHVMCKCSQQHLGSRILNLCSFLHVINQVSYQYRTTCKIIITPCVTI